MTNTIHKKRWLIIKLNTSPLHHKPKEMDRLSVYYNIIACRDHLVDSMRWSPQWSLYVQHRMLFLKIIIIILLRSIDLNTQMSQNTRPSTSSWTHLTKPTSVSKVAFKRDSSRFCQWSPSTSPESDELWDTILMSILPVWRKLRGARQR